MTATGNIGPRCPNDDGTLRQVSARTRLGSAVLLDQCDTCGGIWLDRFELFQVGQEEAARIDGIDEQALRYPMGEHPQPLCPRCRKPLEVFHDPSIPRNIQLLFCTACEGFWLNHGALSGYAGFRSESRAVAKTEPDLAGQYEKMLKASSDADKWNAIARFGNSIGGHRDMLTGLPLDGTPAQLDRIDEAHDFAFAAIRTVFRLLFGV